MKLRPQMLEMPLPERLSYDAGKNILFLNFEGLSIRSHDDIERVRQAVTEKLAPLGHRVDAIVNYDRFSILPELVDDYIDMVKVLMETCYHDVTRFTSNTFLRARLGEALEKAENRRAQLRNCGRSRSEPRSTVIRCASVRGNAGRAISWPAFLHPGREGG
jgi:propionate CoA-transferase